MKYYTQHRRPIPASPVKLKASETDQTHNIPVNRLIASMTISQSLMPSEVTDFVDDFDDVPSFRPYEQDIAYLGNQITNAHYRKPANVAKRNIPAQGEGVPFVPAANAVGSAVSQNGSEKSNPPTSSVVKAQ
jgi:hypothetical protein